MLLNGENTEGRYCLIDMHVPPGGGPPPHRHDFEETFSLLDGEIVFTFRGEQLSAHAGDTVSIPANAPHQFQNASEAPARMLCFCSPAGQEKFFAAIGVSVANRTAPAPPSSAEAAEELKQKAAALAGLYRTEFLPNFR